jgi:hypothetical protein
MKVNVTFALTDEHRQAIANERGIDGERAAHSVCKGYLLNAVANELERAVAEWRCHWQFNPLVGKKRLKKSGRIS